MFYYETARPTGGWAPNASPAAPPASKQDGVLRYGLSGTGARIRAIQRIPAQMIGLTLDDLQRHLSPGSEGNSGGADAA